eukprot:CAMPEP_0206038634 /NCGR_PEP_ID=MMETSP1466-20131121/4239_1 /ASSEMBLY_ACC=CAM_ASM_001126 /TAXON_ID=44452 /ORGANISM="Pavlova gyrans, Strain CCMP608" /LENGTH=49 /DNA_ID=CAMNT_0053413235 /DNA_START=225 /DNA_END=377 /DNA_ORIENTATION=+
MVTRELLHACPRVSTSDAASGTSPVRAQTTPRAQVMPGCSHCATSAMAW